MLPWFKAFQDQSKEAECSYQTLPNDGSSDVGDEKTVSNDRLDRLILIVLGVTSCAFVLSLFFYIRMQ